MKSSPPMIRRMLSRRGSQLARKVAQSNMVHPPRVCRRLCLPHWPSVADIPSPTARAPGGSTKREVPGFRRPCGEGILPRYGLRGRIMKIARIESFIFGTKSSKDLLFCRVESEDGTHGWGEAYVTAGKETVIAECIRAMAPHVIGRD